MAQESMIGGSVSEDWLMTSRRRTGPALLVGTERRRQPLSVRPRPPVHREGNYRRSQPDGTVQTEPSHASPEVKGSIQPRRRAQLQILLPR
jgi:hypothetical protein